MTCASNSSSDQNRSGPMAPVCTSGARICVCVRATMAPREVGMAYVQIKRMPVTVAAAFRTKVVTVGASAIVIGSVGCSPMPVSPAMPFSVSAAVLPAGGTIVTLTTVAPLGTVMVFAPEARFLISFWPGLAGFCAAALVCVAVTSPVKVIVVTLALAVDIESLL